jgi:hypothetical protein
VLESLARPSVAIPLVDGSFVAPPSAFVASILNDIRREQPKIRDKDNLRLAQVCSFVAEFFTLARQKAADNIAARAKAGESVEKQREELQHLWNYGYLAEFCDMATIVHLNKRLYLVMDDSVRSNSLLLICRPRR